MADYAPLAASSPGFAAAGNAIAQQLISEGEEAGTSSAEVQDNIALAQTHLASVYTDLAMSGSGFQTPVDGLTGVINIAQETVVAAHTVIGAVTSVGNLLSAANSSDPKAVTAAGNMIVGTVVGLAVSAGLASAGVGAVIVAGVALLGAAINAITGSTPPVAMVCGSGLNKVPTIVVGCVYSITAGAPPHAVIAPASPIWRHFPELATDPDWFTPLSPVAENTFYKAITWCGDVWASAFQSLPLRMVDAAFPNYGEVQRMGANGGFGAAFFTAWKANQAYALNGLKTQDDVQVLLYTLRTWNMAHAPGNPTLIGVDSSYIGSLVAQIQAWDSGDTNFVDGQYLSVNTGALKGPKKIATLRLLPKVGAATSTSTAATLTKSVVVASVVGLGATAIYARMTGKAFLTTLKGFF